MHDHALPETSWSATAEAVNPILESPSQMILYNEALTSDGPLQASAVTANDFVGIVKWATLL